MQTNLRLGTALSAVLLVQPLGEPGRGEAFELINVAPDRTIDTVLGTGQLIRVDRAFARLFVADPGVADIEVKSP